MFTLCYNTKGIKQSDNRARKSEESPCIQGQAAGETPGSVSWRIGPQKKYCSPPLWQERWCNGELRASPAISEGIG